MTRSALRRAQGLESLGELGTLSPSKRPADTAPLGLSGLCVFNAFWLRPKTALEQFAVHHPGIFPSSRNDAFVSCLPDPTSASHRKDGEIAPQRGTSKSPSTFSPLALLSVLGAMRYGNSTKVGCGSTGLNPWRSWRPWRERFVSNHSPVVPPALLPSNFFRAKDAWNAKWSRRSFRPIRVFLCTAIDESRRFPRGILTEDCTHGAPLIWLRLRRAMLFRGHPSFGPVWFDSL